MCFSVQNPSWRRRVRHQLCCHVTRVKEERNSETTQNTPTHNTQHTTHNNNTQQHTTTHNNTQPPHNHHTTTTQPPHNHHHTTTTTQPPPHNHHHTTTTTTPPPHNHHHTTTTTTPAPQHHTNTPTHQQTNKPTNQKTNKPTNQQTCSTPLMAWSGGMSPGRADELLVWLSVPGEFLPVVVQRQALGWFSAEHESLFMRQSTVASGRISAFLARAVHTWKIGVFFPSGFVSGSHTSCVWVLLVEYRTLNSSGDSVVSRATLGLTVNTCSASVRDASGRNAHIFYVDVDSNPEVVLFRSHAEWRSTSVDASGALKSRIFMHELHVAGRVHDEG